MKLKLTVFRRFLVGAATLLWVGAVPAEPPADDDTGSAAGNAATVMVDPDAKELLMDMARFLSGLERFGVTVRSHYDAVQGWGQKIEFGEVRDIVISRPQGLRVAVTQSSGEETLILFDGNELIVYSPSQNVYAAAVGPRTVDDALVHFLRDLKMRLPLAMMLVSTLPAELEHRVIALDYVERTEILGVPAHHLAARTETVDFQVWVAEGGQPFPLRAVLTYKDVPGEPQYRARFSDWNLSPPLTEAMFRFRPPVETAKIPFLPQLLAVGAEPPQAEGKPGEKP